MDEYTKEISRLKNNALSESNSNAHYNEKIMGYNDIIIKLDNDLKAKDTLIVKLQWSKGEIKDQVFQRDNIIEDLKAKLESAEKRNSEM